MQIHSIQSFTGRNIYSHRPVIKMVVDFGNLYEKPTNQIDHFNEKLVDLFPGLKNHYCSLGHEGGFLERLEEGTYIGHVTEHLILEMQSMLGYEVCFGRTRVIREPSLYYIAYEYKNEICGIECGKAAVGIISDIIKGEKIDINDLMRNLKKISVETELGPSTKAIYDEAKKRNIPVSRMGNESLLQLGYGKYLRLVEASLTDATSCIAADIAGNKHLTKQILRDNRIPVPEGGIAYTEMSAVNLAREIGYPVVVKPFDSNQGKGVTLNITSESTIRKAYHEALNYSKAVILEKYIYGKDYRILVIGGKVSAVSERRPPQVVGDGVHSIRELVDMENQNNLRGDGHEKPLTKIKLDRVARQVLDSYGYDEEFIPARDEVIPLRGNGNLSTGGTARDCTDEIHPDNALIAVKAAKLLGLDIAGIDITAEDIGKPITEAGGAIVEVNAAPGLRMHIYPTEGKPNNVASDIIDMMFPEGKPASVPIVSITGTNGKTTTTRLVRHALTLAGLRVGMTSTSGIYIGDECIMEGDNTGPISARIVLSNKEIDAAVLETARGGIVKRGLGYDLADVGIVTNISDDHLGLDGIETLEDLAHVKALVIEAVKPEGYSLINADDKMASYLKERARGRVMLFSKDGNNLLLKEHMQSGGKAVFVRDGYVCIFDGEKGVKLIKVDEIPITYNGVAECNVENALSTVSALHALNVPFDIIRKALQTFIPDAVSNPGRFNIFDMGDFKVMLDYCHNAAGCRELAKFVEKVDAKRLVGIIGMPGDRNNASIEEFGQICAKTFSKIYIKEDSDLRDRAPGEVADILFDSVMRNGMKKDNVNVIYSEVMALEHAILDAQPGDFIVMYYEEFEPCYELVMRLKGEIEEERMLATVAVIEPAG